ncbi:OLC1v1012082C1 [Oldenlandia corymbosa var. corymbosa]|uniref:OLC1v1012082C1 n=1 Tax=Oldenlandia corymbosa var. corymbosa TaxID=529605 RepID=A0AAV1DV95_OLDCO|nr:OLC1v1012082C1 [Oldenlandia corymbosa var. corymbosa]
MELALPVVGGDNVFVTSADVEKRVRELMDCGGGKREIDQGKNPMQRKRKQN